mmetsp:Transcript_101009/g.289925  ORF Transcript_101009/g.289925 Transcript_101009/m.289925 type:complete len:221 (-) Transcript_101009:995-1657(-)
MPSSPRTRAARYSLGPPGSRKGPRWSTDRRDPWSCNTRIAESCSTLGCSRGPRNRTLPSLRAPPPTPAQWWGTTATTATTSAGRPSWKMSPQMRSLLPSSATVRRGHPFSSPLAGGCCVGGLCPSSSLVPALAASRPCCASDEGSAVEQGQTRDSHGPHGYSTRTSCPRTNWTASWAGPHRSRRAATPPSPNRPPDPRDDRRPGLWGSVPASWWCGWKWC